MEHFNRILLRLRSACDQYLAKEIPLDNLTSMIQATARELESVENRSLVNYLMRIEGKLDIARHTTSEDQLGEVTAKYVEELVERVDTELSQPPSAQPE